MRYLMTLVGIVLIAGGIGLYVNNTFSYTDKEKVAQLGSIELTTQTEKYIQIPPAACGAAVLVGLVLVVIGVRKKKK